ncbi:MAG: hypothetical protein Q4D35_02505 [Ruminococcus sp.]|nr:hypothetical protein [Ruminococcus sp.]
MKLYISKTTYKADHCGLLGYVGETNARTIEVTQPEVEGADTYRLRFKYGDDVVYDVPIVDGVVTVTGSLLREVGEIECQWLATKSDGENYDLVAKSNIFKVNIDKSISDDIAPIPTYEQAVEVLDRILNAEGTSYDDSELRQLIINNGTEINRIESEIPTKTSQIDNDSGFVSDANYVHTDNNYTTAEKEKLAGLENYDDTSIREAVNEKATIQDVATYVNEHKDELKGDTGERGEQGIQGERGADGYTPVKGVDYWTDSDINEIYSYVDGLIGEANAILENRLNGGVSA